MTIIASFVFTGSAQAYIDPGTTQAVGSIWPMIAPVIAVVLAVVGFMFRPVRVFFMSMLYKLLGRSEVDQVEVDEEAPADD
jgi:hypothetical protein